MPYMSGYEACPPSPLLAAPDPPPHPAPPPPPPTLKVVREWEGVGVWPDATPPPPPPVATADFVPHSNALGTLGNTHYVANPPICGLLLILSPAMKRWKHPRR